MYVDEPYTTHMYQKIAIATRDYMIVGVLFVRCNNFNKYGEIRDWLEDTVSNKMYNIQHKIAGYYSVFSGLECP